MDGLKSAVALLGLALTCCGCITTQEKKVVLRNENEPSPFATPAKEQPKTPPPPRVLIAMAEMREREADVARDKPEAQARLRDEARLAYQELLKNDPGSVEGFRGLARVYGGMGDYARAIDTYQKGLAKHPRDVNLWYDLGMLHGRRKDWAESVQCFRKGLEIDPENQRCLKAMGFTLARAGQFDASFPFLTRAMGSACAAHTNVALMLMHMAEQDPGQKTQREELARAHLQAALQENPNYERARELLECFDSPSSATPIHGTVDIFGDQDQ